MWGRFEAITAIFFISFLPQTAMAQELPVGIIKLIETEAESGGSDGESLAAFYEHLMEHPLNINRASRGDLEKITLLSDFQIESILDYRIGYGDIVSAAELSLIDGFNMEKVSGLLPFITFGALPDVIPAGRERVNNKLILRTRRNFRKESSSGIPYYVYSKYRLKYKEYLQAGFTIENDICEPIYPDFLSLYLQAKNLPLSSSVNFRLESGIVGDYSAKMGQGLVLWNSFSVSGFGDPSSVFKKETAVAPYTSSEEQDFFRGAAVTLSYNDRYRLTLLYSDNRRDAKVDDKYYYSLPEGGIHVSDNEIASRKTLLEHLIGANVSGSFGRMKIGVSAAFYAFDKGNKRRKSEYNRYRMYDGWWGNMAADACWVRGSCRLFAEAAVDMGGAPATVAGAIWQIGPKIESSLLLRSYSKSYIAPHAGAYSSTSDVANETGALVNMKWLAGNSFSFSATADFAYHPWQRFGISAPSSVLKMRWQGDWLPDGSNSIYCRLTYSYGTFGNTHKAGVRVNYSYGGNSGFSAGGRIELCWNNLFKGVMPLGVMAMIQFGYKSLREKFECSVRGTVYHADNWENRIYSYERDLPQSFSVTALYGRGADVYGYFRFKPLKWLDLCLKISLKAAKMQLNLTF